MAKTIDATNVSKNAAIGVNDAFKDAYKTPKALNLAVKLAELGNAGLVIDSPLSPVPQSFFAKDVAFRLIVAFF